MKLNHLAAMVVACALPAAANAATVIYTSATIPLTATDFTNTPLALQQFDPTLGTLTGIEVSLTGNVSSTIMFENLGSAGTITGSSMAQLTLTRPDSSTIVIALPTQTRTASEGAFDGVIDFSGTSGDTFSGVNGTATNISFLTSPADFTLFTGTGFVDAFLSGHGTSSASGPGNLATIVNTSAGGFATIAYTYNSLVPEPAAWALMIVGFGGIGAMLRDQRNRLTPV
jgi:hypothetical protein